MLASVYLTASSQNTMCIIAMHVCCFDIISYALVRSVEEVAADSNAKDDVSIGTKRRRDSSAVAAGGHRKRMCQMMKLD